MRRVLFLMALSLPFAPLSLLAQESERGPMVVEGSPACEDNIANLEGIVAKAQESNERIFVIARLGRGESSRRLTRRRLHNAQRYLSVVRGLKSENLVFAEGEPSNGKGRVEFYLGGKFVLVSVVERGGDLCICCCEDERCGRYYGWGKKENRRRQRALRYLRPQPNNGLHPTANSRAFIARLGRSAVECAAGDAGR